MDAQPKFNPLKGDDMASYGFSYWGLWRSLRGYPSLNKNKVLYDYGAFFILHFRKQLFCAMCKFSIYKHNELFSLQSRRQLPKFIEVYWMFLQIISLHLVCRKMNPQFSYHSPKMSFNFINYSPWMVLVWDEGKIYTMQINFTVIFGWFY